MTIYDKVPLFRKVYAFTIIMHQVIHNMSREYRYTLGAETIKILWNCLDLIMSASRSSKTEKTEKILKLSEEFSRVNVRLRAMQELKIISVGQYAHWQKNYLFDIGKQIGGWVRWAEKSTEI